MKTDYDDYKRANKIKESWPEKTPLALRDKIFIALIAGLVLLTVAHGMLNYSGLTADDRSDLRWWLFFDVLIACAAIAQMVFPQPMFLADEAIRRPAEMLIDGMRLFCGVAGVTFALFFGYTLESDLLAMVPFDVRVIFGFCAVMVIELVAYFVWLSRGKK